MRFTREEWPTSMLTGELLLQSGAAGRGSVPGERHWGSLTVVRESGCYAYQVDGLDFSYVIVVRVELDQNP